MDDRPVSASRGLYPLDLVALATTVCLVITVAFIQVKVLPTYAAILTQGGFSMPPSVRIAGSLLARMPAYGLLLLLGWALYHRLRRQRAHPRTLPRVLAVVNILAVVVLMAQTSGLVAFALHGFKAVHNVIATREQEQARGRQPSSLVPPR